MLGGLTMLCLAGGLAAWRRAPERDPRNAVTRIVLAAVARTCFGAALVLTITLTWINL